jgi:hypothetical protein
LFDWWTVLRSLGFTTEELQQRDLTDSTDFGETIRLTSAYSAAAEYLDGDNTDAMDYKIRGGYGGGGGTSGGGSGSGNGTYVPPKSGYSSATGAVVGASAAAGATGLFLALHYRGRVVGCVQPGEDGLRLLDESKNKSYALIPGDVSVKPGQRVQLKGQKSKNDAGEQVFKAKKLLKDLGTCNSPAPETSKAAAGQ